MVGVGEESRPAPGVTVVILGAGAEMAGKGLAVDIDFLVAFAPPVFHRIIDGEGDAGEDALAFGGEIVPIHHRAARHIEGGAPLGVEMHRGRGPLIIAQDDFPGERRLFPGGVDQLHHRVVLEGHEPVAIHLAILRHAQGQGGVGIDPGGAAIEVAQGRRDGLLAVEGQLHEDAAQGGFTVGGRHFDQATGKRLGTRKTLARGFAGGQTKLEGLGVPVRRLRLARRVEPGAQFLDRARQLGQLLTLERGDRGAGRIGTVIDVIVEIAGVAGDLAMAGVGDGEVEVPALAVFAGDRPGPAREFAAQHLGHGRLDDRRGGVVEIDAQGARRIGRPEAYDRARSRGVHHDIFLPSVDLLHAQVLAAIAVGEPILVARGFGFAVVGGKLLAGVGRIREFRQAGQVGHVVQQTSGGDVLAVGGRGGQPAQDRQGAGLDGEEPVAVSPASGGGRLGRNVHRTSAGSRESFLKFVSLVHAPEDTRARADKQAGSRQKNVGAGLSRAVAGGCCGVLRGLVFLAQHPGVGRGRWGSLGDLPRGFAEDLLQIGHAHRFADIVVHARGQTLVAVSLHRVGGEGHNPDPARAAGGFELAEAASGGVAVHFRHLAIHQHDIVMDAVDGFERLKPVGRDVGRETEFLQLLQGHFLIDDVVLGQQDLEVTAQGDRLVLAGFRRVGRRALAGRGHDAEQGLEQLSLLDGFDQPGFDASLLHGGRMDPLAHRGQDHHLGMAKPRVGLDFLGHRQAVHPGHHHVQDDQAIGIPGRDRLVQCGERLEPAGHRAAVAHVPAQDLMVKDRAVGRVVIHNERANAPQGLRVRRRLDLGMLLFGQAHREPENRTLARRAGDTDLAPHDFHQPPGDGQAQTRTAIFPGGGFVRLLEGVEQPLPRLRGNANAGVGDGHMQEHVLRRLFGEADFEQHLPLFRELDGIA